MQGHLEWLSDEAADDGLLVTRAHICKCLAMYYVVTKHFDVPVKELTHDF